jgi:hypothetical protein
LNAEQHESDYDWQLLEKSLAEAAPNRTPQMSIDLPHNQRIIIGHLDPDTIVEIATWAGSGAPDANAVRMLIGAQLTNTSTEVTVGGPPVASRLADNQLELEPTEKFATTEKHKMKKAKTHMTQAQVAVGRKELRRQMKRITTRNRMLYTFGGLASIFLILTGLNLTKALVFDHPQVGPDLPFGSSTSSLVTLSPRSDLKPGDFAIVTLDGTRHFVRVDAVNERKYEISTMIGPAVVYGASVNGKVGLIIPFIGVFWQLVGQ